MDKNAIQRYFVQSFTRGNEKRAQEQALVSNLDRLATFLLESFTALKGDRHQDDHEAICERVLEAISAKNPHLYVFGKVNLQKVDVARFYRKKAQIFDGARASDKIRQRRIDFSGRADTADYFAELRESRKLGDDFKFRHRRDIDVQEWGHRPHSRRLSSREVAMTRA